MFNSDLTRLKKWFHEYVAGFYTNDIFLNLAFDLKLKHTKRVCGNIVMICRDLGLSEQDTLIAETVALLHDTGRFKQFAVYGTFMDKISENHAMLGVRQIASHRILTGLTKKEKRIISKTVAYHNLAIIPDNVDVKTALFLRLIRDADKLDIWKIVTDYYHEKDPKPNPVMEMGLPDDPVCSKKVIESLKLHKSVSLKNIKTLSDFKLLQISWVFDLNFLYSFRQVANSGFLDKIEETLPKTSQISEVLKCARDYVTHRISSV